MPIRILAPEVVAQIAAGEVVERPASVVKELVENSLDAGASQITVETRGGGVDLIRVTDNGSGIPSGELELVCQRHATSKIASLEDLASISSLGFRGEALPSIAAVADVEIVTCAAGESTGSFLGLKDGQATDQGSRGHPQGTTVTVRYLFQKVPARLKFLKSLATENSHIANVASQYALAFPEVRFNLSIDGKSTLSTPGSGQLLDSIIGVYGPETARRMLEINSADDNWAGSTATSSTTVTGMVGTPAISRANRNYLSFFVNRRWINSRLLAWAVEEAYHGLLMTGKHPVAVINVSLPPGEVDVNIHPAKSEGKFQNERLVFSAVQKAVRRALVSQAPVPGIEEIATVYTAPPRPGQPPRPLVPTAHHAVSPPPPPAPALPFSLPALRILGQLASSYIVAEGPDGLYLIDQHAAHERIMFEKIKHQLSRREVEVQGLLEPATIEVSPRQDVMLRACCEELSDFGFSLEPFGDRTYLVRTVPAWLYRKDWAGALRELYDTPAGGSQDDWPEKFAISLACHSAVRAGQVLSDDEMRELVRQLEQAALPNTCPHGRPTLIHLSTRQLEKEFGRS